MTHLPVQADTGRLEPPALLVHGGAGMFSGIEDGRDVDWLTDGLRQALAAGWDVLAGGGGSFAAVVEAVACLEDSGRFNAGRGAVTTSDGTHEFDAGVMDGATGKVGAICAATWPANPVRVAMAVAEDGGTPNGPLLLAGVGADRYAEAEGWPRMTPAMLARARASGDGRRGLAGQDQRGSAEPRPSGESRGTGHAPEPSSAGTVGAVAVDAGGNVAAATSTGGRSGQLRGRVGDSPIPGAGVWAAPGTVAVSATGAGEAFVVAGFAHLVEWRLRAGGVLAAAVGEALDAVAALGGDGGAISICPDGSFTASFNSRAMARGWRDATGESVALFAV
ncbi:MAG: isoaspartyl peptidase/L-asparaginase family protein [Acidimicrobiales bacterium]